MVLNPPAPNAVVHVNNPVQTAAEKVHPTERLNIMVFKCIPSESLQAAHRGVSHEVIH
jgi:hypothetical protein